MKHVSILIPQGHFSLVNIEGTHQILSWVNEWLQETGRRPLFKLNLVGLSKTTIQSNGLFTINPELLVHDVTKTDLIILPAIHGDLQNNLKLNADLVPWLVKQYKNGAEIVSLCIGSFFLAATGLLNGKQCATHWRFANDFRKLFPEAKLMDDKIITEADGIYTSGGAYSFTNLLIYLIEKYAGREVAIVTAKTFMIDIERSSQSPFIMFVGQKAHQDQAVLEAQEYIEQNFQEKITVDELSDNLGVGRRTFERRFKKATSNTVVEYIQRVKIEAAKKQLESGRKTVNEVMYDVGYTDTKAFRDVFKKITGMSPVDYRNKYNKEMLN
ncbi:MAG: helix-turn-helix domain-containing protein [Bacteroidota bacterium]|nr:helix-turn-helix domain-containing protein [Flavisolibacter sp.]MDQ3845580.1 helix-turn-helix domain-containing protein [Bacteroidota bacterium]MBD0287377.1 helix-turn-helix domain-containing protein [Flavisolibacter sp.]MBD0349750.1 helix-turn-helix domain-containing protein [Flavisolibacter sp.]MBD0366325.1 helix-turn-helix domain-containing protein [Flavisolibacter sp.]